MTIRGPGPIADDCVCPDGDLGWHYPACIGGHYTKPPEDSPEAIACRHCRAEAGKPCTTPNGRKCEAHLHRRRAYRRRMTEAGTLPGGDSRIARLARAEADARDQLDHT